MSGIHASVSVQKTIFVTHFLHTALPPSSQIPTSLLLETHAQLSSEVADNIAWGSCCGNSDTAVLNVYKSGKTWHQDEVKQFSECKSHLCGAGNTMVCLLSWSKVVLRGGYTYLATLNVRDALCSFLVCSLWWREKAGLWGGQTKVEKYVFDTRTRRSVWLHLCDLFPAHTALNCQLLPPSQAHPNPSQHTHSQTRTHHSVPPGHCVKSAGMS